MNIKSVDIKKYIGPLILIVVAIVFPLLLQSKQAYICQALISAMIYLVAVYGINFVTGMAGQINIGMAGTICIGAYTSGLLTTKLGVSPWFALIGVILVGVLIGFILGYPSLRIKGIYLALTTIAFTEIARKVITNVDGLTGGSMGLKGIPYYNFCGIKLNSPLKFYFFMLAVIIILSFICNYIIKGKWGRAFNAVKDDDIAAESCGINITSVKLTAYILSSIFGCMAGAFFAHNQHYLNPTTFTLDMSFSILVMMIFGGSGNIYGCILGAVSVTILPELLRFLGEYYKIVYSVIVLLICVFAPGGLMSIGRRIIGSIEGKQKSKVCGAGKEAQQ